MLQPQTPKCQRNLHPCLYGTHLNLRTWTVAQLQAVQPHRCLWWEGAVTVSQDGIEKANESGQNLMNTTVAIQSAFDSA